MPSLIDMLAALVAGPFLWLAGAVFFDFVHWILHMMLGSRWAVLRALAWPHSIHHKWIDTNLEVRWEYQNRNIWCHLLLEYLTQVVFSLALLLTLPPRFVVVLLTLQTTVFALLLRARGLDPNHRAIDYLDAYAPGFHTPPAYHALHHVYPTAYFSAYTKVVDWLVAGGAQLRGRSYATAGDGLVVTDAFRRELSRLGVTHVAEWSSMTTHEREKLDVLILCGGDVARSVEEFIAVTARRKLPPEVWSLHGRPDDPIARAYHRDVRVNYRTILLRDSANGEAADVVAAVRTALGRIRRGFNFVTTARGWRVMADWLQFTRTRTGSPRRPGALRRADLARAQLARLCFLRSAGR